MDRQVRDMFVQSVSFFIFGVVLSSLFVWSMMQGIFVHAGSPVNGELAGNDAVAFSYYFVAWMSGIAALALYWQAKNLYHYAKISQ